MLYAKLDADEDDRKKITEALQKDVGKDKFFTNSPKSGRLQFWAAPLSSKRVEDYRKMKGMNLVEKEGKPGDWAAGEETSGNGKRDLKKQPLSRDEMKFISQPKSIEKIKDTPDYLYDDSAGTGITIYIVNAGANMENKVSNLLTPFVPLSTNTYSSQEFSEIKKEKREEWLFPNPQDTVKEDAAPGKGHGTCVAAKAVGKELGVAKNANIVLVKVGQRNEFRFFLQGLLLVIDHVEKNKLEGKAVINISGADHKRTKEETEALQEAIIKPLFDLGVVIVAAAGNSAKESKDINSWPQVVADDFPIINVGNVDNEGKTRETSQGGKLLVISAPGVDVWCPEREAQKFSARTGTSFCKFSWRSAADHLPSALSIPHSCHFYYSLLIEFLPTECPTQSHELSPQPAPPSPHAFPSPSLHFYPSVP